MRSADFRAANDAPAAPHPGQPEAGAWTPQSTPADLSPCVQPRAEVDSRCADAERLTTAAEFARDELRDLRRRHSELTSRREADAYARDRRHIAEEKTAAQAEYHTAVTRALDLAAVHDAAAAWLHNMDETNRRAREADDRGEDLAARIGELERILPNMELKADAARISAESAQAACMDARRVLAACEEQHSAAPASSSHGLALAPSAPPTVEPSQTPTQTQAPTPTQTQAAPSGAGNGPSPRAEVNKAAGTLMHGDREVLLGLALRLADETGMEAGRLQLLLLELRESISARALEKYALSFPADHPFWSQFPSETARNVVASLASLGFQFDGASGWADGRIPQVRDLAVALSYCGYDPRSMRRPAGQAAVDALWEGTQVRGEEYLLALAPNLALDEVVALLGASANRLGELWDIWGRLRPLLLRAP